MASAVATLIQSLECSLCFNLPEEPKLLSCTHSYCEKCLHHLHNSQGNGTELLCPLCRHITKISNKDVSSLKTNVPLKSLIGDVKKTRKICTVCDPEDKSSAVYYCQECDEYMCDECLEGHGGFRKNASHVVVSMNDIKCGKVKVKQICHKHPREERLWVCTSCKVSICFRCRMLDHNGSDHVIQEVEDFKKNMQDEIESFQKRGMEKIETFTSYKKVVREQTLKVEASIAEREVDINEAFDGKLLELKAEKIALLDQCKEKKRKLTEGLCQHGRNLDEFIASLNSACELVGNGMRALLEGEALAVHSNLCRKLQDMLDREDPDVSQTNQVAFQAEGVKFTRCRHDDEHNLGMITVKDWMLSKVAEFPTSGTKPVSMASAKYSKMLVGYEDGVIEEFTVSGQSKIVLKGVSTRRVSVLSDGRYVLRDWSGKIYLYSNDWNKLDTNELGMKASDGFGGLDVDKCNNIYVGCYNAKTIRVFTPEGWTFIRQIACYGFEPYSICTMNHSNMLVIGDIISFVRVIDQQGTVKHDVTKEGFFACPAVLYDDSILIGWWKDGLVSIDLYTNQLKHMRTVISRLESGGQLTMREFSSGEIAFCAESKLYVLCKKY